MKYKIKEINCENISFSKVELNNGIVHNIKYNEDSLEFQSPKMKIHSLVKENDHEYLILKIAGNQACKTFCLKIKEIEAFFSRRFNIGSVFHEDLLTVKIPFKYSKPLVKVYKNENLFNYYHLEEDLEILCLLCIDKIWVNNFNEASYQLNVKELMII
jgi:hypothetical protein